MGTRSYIALQIEEDEYLTIFCHYNGYPDDNGAILAEHYDKQEKVESLIQLGDLYFLRSKLEPNPDLPHNHSTPQPNVTIAYNRDEGWSDYEAVHKTLDELNDPGEIGIEFTYIFTFEGRWIYFPTGEAELGFRDVKEDLDNDTVQYDSFSPSMKTIWTGQIMVTSPSTRIYACDRPMMMCGRVNCTISA